MIKRTMYFYDRKQADLIKKVNDKLHRQRGVKVADIESSIDKDKELLKSYYNEYINTLKTGNMWSSKKADFLKSINDIYSSISIITNIVFGNKKIEGNNWRTIENKIDSIYTKCDKLLSMYSFEGAVIKEASFSKVDAILSQINEAAMYLKNSKDLEISYGDLVRKHINNIVVCVKQSQTIFMAYKNYFTDVKKAKDMWNKKIRPILLKAEKQGWYNEAKSIVYK